MIKIGSKLTKNDNRVEEVELEVTQVDSIYAYARRLINGRVDGPIIQIRHRNIHTDGLKRKTGYNVK